ncbi:MAG: hypothetical protein SGPRY_011166 [Prymnesium sp.]
MAECAICYDSLTEASRLALPCSCAAPCCLSCWDRALAASFNDSGRARCPTCRSTIAVDFDGETGLLIFSSGASDQATAESRAQFVNRLAQRAAPRMTRSLRAYGEAHPTLRAVAQDPVALLDACSVDELRGMLRSMGEEVSPSLAKPQLIATLRSVAGENGRLAACYAACVKSEHDGASLRCVCGGEIERLDGRERCRQLFAGQLEQELVEQLLVAQFQAANIWSYVVCDLCDEEVSPRRHVYTCQHGEKTILHPTTYDVCEPCFIRYAVEGRDDEGLAIHRRAPKSS